MKKTYERSEEGFYALLARNGYIIKVFETRWLAERERIEIWKDKKLKIVPVTIIYKPNPLP